MGQVRQGAEEILGMAEEKDYDPALEPALAATLHSSQWREISLRAAELFPVPKGKDHPVPAIADLDRMRGDRANGQLVFAEAGTCAKCHVVAGKGTEVGPDLSEIGSKLSRTALYESILFPSAGIGHGYEDWSVLTDEGATVQGLLVSETNEEVKIKNKDGVIQTIAVESIESKKQQSISMMPADLHKELTTQELVDLVAYMQTLRK